MFLHTIKEVIKSNDTMRNAALKVYYEKRKHDIQNDYIGFLKKDFRKSLGYDLHLDHPVTFNEKLQWLKVHYRDPIMTQCADKYEVRKLIEEKSVDHIWCPYMAHMTMRKRLIRTLCRSSLC